MEQTVAVTGGEIRADDSGGDGLPLVLLHPGIADSRVWDPVLPALTARHRVIRYDARGFGGSPPPTGPYTQSADLERVLDHFGADRAVLVGSSMGGRTAIGFALSEPDRVAALGLLVPGVSGYPELESPELTEQIVRLATAGDMDGLLALFRRTFAAAGSDPDTRAAELIRASFQGVFSSYGHEQPEPPAFERLRELGMPCSLLLGEQDMPQVVACNEAMAARIPGCRLVRVPESDHLPTLRAPETVARVITDLIERAE
ncbi:alpha/beta fold hydrolase [Streptomyces sp. NPDC052101]|uniref:alpha/beta fold hydrolase n=1 Tax=Streptomyces sp. NPDC052101 TaxID=3155763 RepID=UPI00343CED96